MIGAVHNEHVERGTSRTTAGWQLSDPACRRERPGTIFRIGPDHRREVVAELPVGWRVEPYLDGPHRLRSDVAAAARCLGLPAPVASRDVLHAPVTVMIDVVAVEAAAGALEDAARGVIDRLDLDGPDRYFVVRACDLGRELSVALPGIGGDALGHDAARSHNPTVISTSRDEITLQLALERPERLAFAVLEIRRTPAGVVLAAVDEVLSWAWDEPRGDAEPAPAAGGAPEDQDSDEDRDSDEDQDSDDEHGASPTFEIAEHDDAYVVTANVVEVSGRDLEIEATGDRIRISGTYDAEPAPGLETFEGRERHPGRFTRSVLLPAGADVDHVEGQLAGGVLTLVVPSRPRAHPRHIAVPGLEALPADHTPAPATTAGPPAIDDAVVHWNTRLRDGDRVVSSLTAGRAIVLETWLGPEGDPGAVLDTSIPADLVPDGTAVTFVVASGTPVLRPLGGGTLALRHTATLTVTGGATQIVAVEVVPDHPGVLTLGLSLYTGGALRVRSRLALAVVPAADPAGAEVAPAPAPAVALHALTGRAAMVRLEITGDGELEIDAAPLHWGPGSPAQRLGELAATAVRVRSQLVALSEAYDARPGPEPFALARPAGAMLAFARIGAELHNAFFGYPDDEAVDASLRRLGAMIAVCPGGRMQIVAGSLPFPWAVMYDGRFRDPDHRLDTEADVDPTRFWGARFQIDRAIDAHLDGTWPPPPGTPVRAQLCLNPNLDAELAIAVLGAQERIFARPGVEYLPVIKDNAALCAFLGRPAEALDLLYLFCHARAAETVTATFFRPREAPDVQASLTLDAADAPGGPLTVGRLRELRRTALGGRPLVLFNACSSAAGDQAFQSKFLTLFVDTWRARGFIGTDWAVNPVFADAFGRRLVERLLDDHLPIADALAAVTRDALAARNPFALIYALYARPDLAFLPTATPGGTP